MKKTIFIITISLFISIFSAFQAGALIGDANCDNTIDIIDALSTAQYYVGMAPTLFDIPAGDVNVDDTVDIVDALLIARYYVGLITELPEAMPGGYSEIPVSSTNALAAYDFLTLELLKSSPDSITLGAAKLAFSQVVNGVNVRLVCSYSDSTSDYFLSAVVYLNLKMIPEEVVSLKFDIY